MYESALSRGTRESLVNWRESFQISFELKFICKNGEIDIRNPSLKAILWMEGLPLEYLKVQRGKYDYAGIPG